MLLNKIEKIRKIDYSGIFFMAIDRIRSRINNSLLNPIVNLTCLSKGVKIGKGVIFNGIPRISRNYYSIIVIGNNCKFNSAKNSVITGLQQPCSFVILQKDAQIIFDNNSGASGLNIAAKNNITIENNEQNSEK